MTWQASAPLSHTASVTPRLAPPLLYLTASCLLNMVPLVRIISGADLLSSNVESLEVSTNSVSLPIANHRLTTNSYRKTCQKDLLIVIHRLTFIYP